MKLITNNRAVKTYDRVSRGESPLLTMLRINKKNIVKLTIILYLTTCHLVAESSFKRERETNYK